MNPLRHKKSLLAIALFIVLAFVTLYGGYTHQSTTPVTETKTTRDAIPYDSTALHLSVIPSMGSLPLYYAVHSGMADSSALRIVLHTTYAQPDVDTAVRRGRVDIGVLPLTYLAMNATEKKSLVAVMTIPERWHLLAAKQLRATSTDKLKGKIVATTRYGAGDFWLNSALQASKIGYDNVFHPQINALNVRLHMVASNQIDAAMLPEPWASIAVQKGCKSLWHTTTNEAQQWAMATQANTLNSKVKRKQISQVIALYGQACQALNQPHNRLRDSLLMALFGLTANDIQTLPRWQWGKPIGVRQGDVKASISFLQERGVVTRSNTRTELYTNSFIPE